MQVQRIALVPPRETPSQTVARVLSRVNRCDADGIAGDYFHELGRHGVVAALEPIARRSDMRIRIGASVTVPYLGSTADEYVFSRGSLTLEQGRAAARRLGTELRDDGTFRIAKVPREHALALVQHVVARRPGMVERLRACLPSLICCRRFEPEGHFDMEPWLRVRNEVERHAAEMPPDIYVHELGRNGLVSELETTALRPDIHVSIGIWPAMRLLRTTDDQFIFDARTLTPDEVRFVERRLGTELRDGMFAVDKRGDARRFPHLLVQYVAPPTFLQRLRRRLSCC